MDKQNKIRPYVRIAMRDDIGEKWNMTRSIWDYELIYIAKGKMNVTVFNKKYVAEQGDIVFLRPNIKHSLTYAGVPTKQPHVHFDLFEDELSDKIYISLKKIEAMSEEEKTWFRSDDLSAIDFDLPVIMHLPNHAEIRDLLYKIIDEFRLKSDNYKMMLSSLMTQMIVLIIRGYKLSKSDLPDQLIKSFDNLHKYIVDNLNTNPSVEQLSSLVYLSKFYFIKVFKEHFGTTPHKYIENLRFEKAKDMLIYGGYNNLSYISDVMHFDSQQSFSRWFKKMSGYSPLEYKKSKKQ